MTVNNHDINDGRVERKRGEKKQMREREREKVYVYRACDVLRVYCPQSMPINDIYTPMNDTHAKRPPI